MVSTSARGRIVQINISRGGVPKRPVGEARVTTPGVDGGAHRDREHHGGPERAVRIFSIEEIRALQAEGHPIAPGSIGENVTIEGLDWQSVLPGAQLVLGDTVSVEVTHFTSPCATITGSFSDGDSSRVSQTRHPGSSRVYTRVLKEGLICPGDSVDLVSGGGDAPARSEG